MKPAPTMPTRIGLPCASRAFSALSTMIIAVLPSRRRSQCAFRALIRRFELGLDLVEQLPACVLRRHLADRQRPLEPEPRVVVAQAALDFGRVELADLVARLGVVLEHLVAVGEALRHVERAVVVGASARRRRAAR